MPAARRQAGTLLVRQSSTSAMRTPEALSQPDALGAAGGLDPGALGLDGRELRQVPRDYWVVDVLSADPGAAPTRRGQSTSAADGTGRESLLVNLAAAHLRRSRGYLHA